jgi:TetR/AcrR family transcriptional regulator, lmrAB and yxaGH operons repressor
MSRPINERKDVLPRLAEVFRAHGYEGASLALISEATGLGKGSLYHFFPSGKEEMAAAVLAEIDGWFRENIFKPLRAAKEPKDAVDAMFDAIARYFDGGGRVCLVGLFALGDERDRFSQAINAYFSEWIESLAQSLRAEGRTPAAARELAEEIVSGVQGGLVMARSLREPEAFLRCLRRLRARAKQS